MCYSAGFFVTVSPESIDLVSSHCNEKDKTYCFNLSAPFIIEARRIPEPFHVFSVDFRTFHVF